MTKSAAQLDITPTDRQRRILEVLATRAGELYGLDLVAAGAAGRGSLYVVLAGLEDRGWIASRAEPPNDSGLSRRLYGITPAGAATLLPAARTIA